MLKNRKALKIIDQFIRILFFFFFFLQHVNTKKYLGRKNELRTNVRIIIDDNRFNH